MITHNFIRILEQPSIFIELLNKIKPMHSKSCLIAKELLGTNPKMLIDVGANKGEFIKAFKYNFPKTRVIAFEPLKEYCENLKQYGEVLNCGLWNKEETKDFYVNGDSKKESSFLMPVNYHHEKRVLELKRFDKLDFPILRPCFLKIDVEGAEDRVLEGFGNRLKEIDLVQIEVLYNGNFENMGKLSKIVQLMEKYGFIGFKQINMYSIGNKPDKSDLIFFR